jgi:hypothetical protein
MCRVADERGWEKIDMATVQVRDNEIVTGMGGKQIIVDDPSGNPIELFQPILNEARLNSKP